MRSLALSGLTGYSRSRALSPVLPAPSQREDQNLGWLFSEDTAKIWVNTPESVVLPTDMCVMQIQDQTVLDTADDFVKVAMVLISDLTLVKVSQVQKLYSSYFRKAYIDRLAHLPLNSILRNVAADKVLFGFVTSHCKYQSSVVGTCIIRDDMETTHRFILLDQTGAPVITDPDHQRARHSALERSIFYIEDRLRLREVSVCLCIVC
jgi:hypothetical protein